MNKKRIRKPTQAQQARALIEEMAHAWLLHSLTPVATLWDASRGERELCKRAADIVAPEGTKVWWIQTDTALGAPRPTPIAIYTNRMPEPMKSDVPMFWRTVPSQEVGDTFWYTDVNGVTVGISRLR